MSSTIHASRDRAGAAVARPLRQRAAAVLSPTPPALGHGRMLIASWGLRAGAAGLLVWIGLIHLHLWQEGYRFIPTNGPLFLLDAVAAFVLAAVLLLWAAPLTGVAAAGFVAGTLGALVISLTVGLFGFHESISASFVVLSIVIESVAVAVLLGWAVLLAGLGLGRSRSPAPSR